MVSTQLMKPFHTRLWMKWEPGDTISPRAHSLPAELLIFPSGAEMIFCPSFLQRISAGQFSPSVPIFCLVLKSRWAESSKPEPRWDERRSWGITLGPGCPMCQYAIHQKEKRDMFMSWKRTMERWVCQCEKPALRWHSSASHQVPNNQILGWAHTSPH